MKTLQIVGLAALGLALTACATPVWVKPGTTQQDYAKDSYECERDALQSGYYGQALAVINRDKFEKRCMIARGWREKSQETAPKQTQPLAQTSPPARFPVSSQ